MIMSQIPSDSKTLTDCLLMCIVFMQPEGSERGIVVCVCCYVYFRCIESVTAWKFMYTLSLKCLLMLATNTLTDLCLFCVFYYL